MGIINLTQHAATPEQIAAGVVPAHFAERLPSLLNFSSIPTPLEIRQRAEVVASLAHDTGAREAMIGGAPFFMAALERALRQCGITPLYAFSERASEEQTQPDGGVRKVNVFRHVGFVRAA